MIYFFLAKVGIKFRRKTFHKKVVKMLLKKICYGERLLIFFCTWRKTFNEMRVFIFYENDFLIRKLI